MKGKLILAVETEDGSLVPVRSHIPDGTLILFLNKKITFQPFNPILDHESEMENREYAYIETLYN